MITIQRKRSAFTFHGTPPETPLGLQCLVCGHVEEPARELYRCLRCGGFDIHVWGTGRTSAPSFVCSRGVPTRRHYAETTHSRGDPN